MMSNYAVVVNGVVANVVVWDGDDEWSPTEGEAILLDDTDASIGWSYSSGEFHPPLEKEKTQDELIQIATETKNALLLLASDALGPLQDAVDLQMATPTESERLIAWKKYRVQLSRIDVSNPNQIVWPEVPKG
ncbi:tail fiber assembly protein [Escherichia coli O141,141ab,141ac:H43]